MIELLLFVVTSFLVGLSGALAPGPMLTVTISDSIEKGFIAGPLIISGHIITEIVLILFLFAGIGWLIDSILTGIIIGIIGGLILILMGLQMFRSRIGSSNKKVKRSYKSKYRSILDGMLTSLANPYFFIWWATIGAAFLFKGIAIAGFLGILGFLIGHWSADIAWYGTVSFLTSRGSNLMTPRSHEYILKVCGSFLIVTGTYFIISTLNITLH